MDMHHEKTSYFQLTMGYSSLRPVFSVAATASSGFWAGAEAGAGAVSEAEEAIVEEIYRVLGLGGEDSGRLCVFGTRQEEPKGKEKNTSVLL